MLTLRCTTKLLRRLGHTAAAEPAAPSTRLGDWYANLLITRPEQLVLCVSERTLLPVLVPARPIGTLTVRFPLAVLEMLRAIGVPGDAIRNEERTMTDVAVGRTASRRVLGSMNDFAWMLDAYRATISSLPQLALRLADTPCGPLRMETPRRATLALFSGQ